MKMFTKSRLMAVIATSAALSMALAGCSNPTADSSSESDTGAQDYWPTATQKLDGVELTMWVAQNSNKIPVKVVSDFEKATGATVKLETIPDPYEQNVQTKTTTGDTPDLAFWQPTQSMLAGFIAQDKLQKLDNAPWVDNYTDGIADAGGVVDGTRYAALVSTPPVMGVFYNKKVFEKAGITDIPRVGMDTLRQPRKSRMPISMEWNLHCLKWVAPSGEPSTQCRFSWLKLLKMVCGIV